MDGSTTSSWLAERRRLSGASCSILVRDFGEADVHTGEVVYRPGSSTGSPDANAGTSSFPKLNAGSIPVTRSLEKAQVSGRFRRLGLRRPRARKGWRDLGVTLRIGASRVGSMGSAERRVDGTGAHLLVSVVERQDLHLEGLSRLQWVFV